MKVISWNVMSVSTLLNYTLANGIGVPVTLIADKEEVRMANILQFLDNSGADLVMLQEVCKADDTSTPSLYDALNQLNNLQTTANLAGVVCRNSTDGKKSFRFDPADYACTILYNPAVFRCDAAFGACLPIRGIANKQPTGSAISIGLFSRHDDDGYNDDAAFSSFVAVSIHQQYPKSGWETEQAAQEACEAILMFHQAYNISLGSLPIIVGGDFNMDANLPAYEQAVGVYMQHLGPRMHSVGNDRSAPTVLLFDELFTDTALTAPDAIFVFPGLSSSSCEIDMQREMDLVEEECTLLASGFQTVSALPAVRQAFAEPFREFGRSSGYRKTDIKFGANPVYRLSLNDPRVVLDTDDAKDDEKSARVREMVAANIDLYMTDTVMSDHLPVVAELTFRNCMLSSSMKESEIAIRSSDASHDTDMSSRGGTSLTSSLQRWEAGGLPVTVGQCRPALPHIDADDIQTTNLDECLSLLEMMRSADSSSSSSSNGAAKPFAIIADDSLATTSPTPGELFLLALRHLVRNNTASKDDIAKLQLLYQAAVVYVLSGGELAYADVVNNKRDRLDVTNAYKRFTQFTPAHQLAHYEEIYPAQRALVQLAINKVVNDVAWIKYTTDAASNAPTPLTPEAARSIETDLVRLSNAGRDWFVEDAKISMTLANDKPVWSAKIVVHFRQPVCDTTLVCDPAHALLNNLSDDPQSEMDYVRHNLSLARRPFRTDIWLGRYRSAHEEEEQRAHRLTLVLGSAPGGNDLRLLTVYPSTPGQRGCVGQPPAGKMPTEILMKLALNTKSVDVTELINATRAWSTRWYLLE